MKKILHLTLKKKWFDLIASGQKKVEYREYKQYWFSRLVKSCGIVMITHVFDEIHFRNGYSKDAPFMRVNHVCTEIDEVQFPDTHDKKECFVIMLGDVLEVRNWKPAGQKNANVSGKTIHNSSSLQLKSELQAS